MFQPSHALVSWGATPQRQATIRIAGFVFERTWIHILFFSIIPFGTVQDHIAVLYSNMALSILFLAATLIAAFIAFSHVARLLLSKYFIMTAAMMCTIGTLVLPFLEQTSKAGITLSLISALATGVGSALLFLGWLRIIGDLDPRQSLREYALALTISYVIAIVLAMVPGIIATAISCTFPFCSAWLLRISSYFRNHKHAEAGREEHAWTFCGQLATTRNLRRMAGIFSTGFVAGLASIAGSSVHQTEPGMSSPLFISGFAIMSVASLTLWFRPHWALRTIHRIAPFTLVTGCTLLSVPSSGNSLASSLTHAGFSCYALSILAVSIFLARALQIDPLRIVCLTFASMYLGELTGLITGQFTEPLLEQATMSGLLRIALTIVTLTSGLFLFSESDLLDIAYHPEMDGDIKRIPGASSVSNTCPDNEFATKTSQETPNAKDIKDICAFLAETYKLTPRESEILPLLLRGRTISRIQEELFISTSTVNTHIRHIYQKCGVPNKQGLIDLVEQIQSGRV